MKKALLLLAATCALTAPAFAGETVQTRIGPLSFTHGFQTGYPTDATIQKLYDERDFQRAVQAYLWLGAKRTSEGLGV